jgi:hypothetical protein
MKEYRIFVANFRKELHGKGDIENNTEKNFRYVDRSD